VRSSSSTILLVCDATFESGSGHVMRQITLGIALKSLGLQPILFCYSIPDALIRRASEFGLLIKKRSSLAESSLLAAEIISANPQFVIFDGYNFALSAVTEVYENNILIMIVDDNGETGHFPSHLLLNQNLHAHHNLYDNGSQDRELLLGAKFCLIRQDVSQQERNFESRRDNQVLIAVGGTDIKSIGNSLTEAMSNTEQFIVTTGSGFLNDQSLSPTELAYEMSRCTVGVFGCGTTLWEAAYLGTPCVALLVADNQVNIAASASLHEIASVIDCRFNVPLKQIQDSVELLLSDKSTRKKVSHKTLSLFDGKGPSRVAQEINKFLSV